MACFGGLALFPHCFPATGVNPRELVQEVIVANVRELRAISHNDRKSDTVDAEKIARYARLDPKILRPISHRTVAQQEALTLIRARNLMVRLRTAAVNSVRGLAKPCGYRPHRHCASPSGAWPCIPTTIG
jgi:transposase